MRIGELAKRTGVTVRTVRYYIEQGLLPPPPRRGKYGEFDESYVPRLQLILRLKEERLSVQAIREHLVEMGFVQGDPAKEEVGGGIFRSRFAEEAGLTSEQVAQLEALGLLESSEGILPSGALPLARAAAYLLEQGASMRDIAMIAEGVRQEIVLYQRLSRRLDSAGRDMANPLIRALAWQEQIGAVRAIREMLLRQWSEFGGEEGR